MQQGLPSLVQGQPEQVQQQQPEQSQVSELTQGVYQPNVELAAYTKNIADKLMEAGRQEGTMQTRNEYEQIMPSLAQHMYNNGVQQGRAETQYNPQEAKVVNDYFLKKLQDSSLTPEEAQQGMESPLVDPRIKQYLQQAIGL